MASACASSSAKAAGSSNLNSAGPSSSARQARTSGDVPAAPANNVGCSTVALSRNRASTAVTSCGLSATISERARLFQPIVEVARRGCAGMPYQADGTGIALDAPACMLIVPGLQCVVMIFHQPEQVAMFRQDHFLLHQCQVCLHQVSAGCSLA